MSERLGDTLRSNPHVNPAGATRSCPWGFGVTHVHQDSLPFCKPQPLGNHKKSPGDTRDFTGPTPTPRSADEPQVHTGPQAKPDARPAFPLALELRPLQPISRFWDLLALSRSRSLCTIVTSFPRISKVANFLVFGVSNFIPLWSENIFGIISSLFNLLRLVGGPSWGMFVCILPPLGGVF